MGLNQLVGNPKPGYLYPRVKYGAITLDFVIPAVNHTPTESVPRGVNYTYTGKAEYLSANRVEETALLELLCEPEQQQQLRWLVRDHAAQGNQMQVTVDRFTGSVWCFENSRRDQNLLQLVLNGGGSETYADATNGKGIVLSGSQYLSVPLAQASAGTPTGFDNPLLHTEGVVVVDFKPTWAANDSVDHIIAGANDTAPAGVDELRIRKRGTNELEVSVFDAAGGEKRRRDMAPSWSANARVRIVASWSSAGTLRLWHAVDAGGFVEGTSDFGAGTGIMSTLADLLVIGAESNATKFALGTYDTVAIFKRAFTDPHRTCVDQRMVDRNYYQYAELVTPIYQPAVFVPTRAERRWPLLLRNGKAA